LRQQVAQIVIAPDRGFQRDARERQQIRTSRVEHRSMCAAQMILPPKNRSAPGAPHRRPPWRA
jgi:hypothetical protein